VASRKIMNSPRPVATSTMEGRAAAGRPSMGRT
jgi:hypothetical protein